MGIEDTHAVERSERANFSRVDGAFDPGVSGAWGGGAPPQGLGACVVATPTGDRGILENSR